MLLISQSQLYLSYRIHFFIHSYFICFPILISLSFIHIFNHLSIHYDLFHILFPYHCEVIP